TRVRRADDCTDGIEADLAHRAFAPLVNEPGYVVPHWTPVLEDGVLQVTARIRRAHDHEDADPAPAHRAEERLDRVATEPGLHRDRVRRDCVDQPAAESRDIAA